MSGCTVTFKFPKTANNIEIKSLQLDTNLTREQLSLNEIASLLTNNGGKKSLTLQNLINTLSTLYIESNKILSVDDYKDDDFIPNYTSNELKEEFPGDWGLIPENVLIVDSNYGIRNAHGYLFKKVFQVGKTKPIYIIPRNYIEQFKAYTKLKEVLSKLESKEDLELPSGYEELFYEIIDKDRQDDKKSNDIRNLVQKIKDRRNKIISDLDKTIKELNDENTEKPELAKRKADTYLQKYNEYKVTLDTELKALSERMHKYDDFCKKSNTFTFIKGINELEINNDDELAALIATVKVVQSNIKSTLPITLVQDIEAKTGLTQILNHYVDHYDEWAQSLSLETLVKLNQFAQELLGKNVMKVSNDPLINTINGIINSYYTGQDYVKVPIEQLGKALVEYGVWKSVPRKQTLHRLLIQNYFGRGNFYNEMPHEDTKNLYFKRRYVSLYEQHQLAMGTDFKPQYQGQINGYYIYKYQNEQGEEVFFYSENLNSKKTSSVEFSGKDALEDIENYIIEISQNQNLYYNNLYILRDLEDKNEDLGLFVSVYGRSLSPGDRIEVLDLKKLGLPSVNMKVPKNFTRNQFYLWVDSIFDSGTDSDIIATIKQKLTTRDQIAYFYNRFYNMPSYQLYYDVYNKTLPAVRDVLQKLTKDPLDIKVYECSDIKFIGTAPEPGKPDLRQRRIELRSVTDNVEVYSDRKTKSDLKEDKQVAIEKVFQDHGINLEYISSKEMKELSGSADTIGWHTSGKIFLNRDAPVTMKTIGHELAHMMLAWIKVNKPEKYQELLEKFANPQNKEDQKTLADSIKNKQANKYYQKEMQNMSPDEQNLFVLEEVFCDAFGLFLSMAHKRNQLDRFLFDEVKEAASKSTIFDDEYKLDDLLETCLDPNKKLISISKLMVEFSTQIRTAKSKVGFGFIMNGGAISKYKKMIENSTDELIKNCDI